MRPRDRFLIASSLAALTLLLAACSSETTITLYQGEAWEVENISQLNLTLLPEISVGNDIIPDLGLGIDIGVDTGSWSEALLDSSLDQLMGHYRSHGIDASWNSRPAGGGQTAYTIQLKGVGWDQLCKSR